MELHTLEQLIALHRPRALLLDAYGVFWRGESGPYPGAVAAMEWLVSLGIRVGILSNASSAARVEIEKVARFGIHAHQHFDFYLTSGEVARTWIPRILQGNNCYELGSPHPLYPTPHSSLLQELGVRVVSSPLEAQWAILQVPHIHGRDEEQIEPFRDIVSSLVPYRLPLVCLNPDRVVLQGGRLVIRQGALAALYAEMGGKVHWIGKPYPIAYQAAAAQFAALGIETPDQIWMVGDTPETDILGANQFGMRSALLCETGVWQARHGQRADQESALLPPDQLPHLLLRRLSL